MDYYDILGVDRGADEKEVKRAYKKLVKKYHPDANPGDKDAAKKFRKITEAYAALSDPEQKAKYDRTEQWKSEEQASRKEDPDQKAKVYQFRSKKQQGVLRLIRPAILTVFLLVLSVLAIRGGGEFPGGEPQVRYWLDNLVEWIGKYKGAAAIVLSLLSGLYMYIRLPGGKFRMVFTAVFTALIPYFAFLSVEAYNRGFWHVGASLSYEIAKPFSSMMILNLLLYYLFFLFWAFLLGSVSAGYCTANSILLGIAIVNYYVVQFRGSPLVPWDFLSLRTAGNVAGNFEYHIYWQMLLATFCFVFLLLTSGKLRLRIRMLLIRLTGIAVCGAALVFLTVSLQSDASKEMWGIDTTLFTPNVRYTKNGFWPAYLSNLSFLNVKKPEGYSPARAEEIADGAQAAYEAESGEKSGSAAAAETGADGAAGTERLPNIIVIMNEAFSDLKAIGDFETSEDYMPFFRSVMDEYTSGNLLVSVKGGNTANTEYEFLSGDTTAFLPAGSVVYQQYIPDELPTLASYLRSLGYRTVAMHPYIASGWERDRVYPLMGFDEFFDQGEFAGAEKIRNYVSDRGAYERVLQELEYNEGGQPLFCFLVTMQNHSGYTPKNTDNGFREEIYLTDAAAQTGSVVACERYLTLIKKSDEAYEYLLDEMDKRVDEPTVIVTFGDHEPGDYITQVIDNLVGNDVFKTASDNSGAKEDGSEESAEDIAKHYQVPFFIWNNFGVEKDAETTWMSPNYLGAYVLQESGVPLSPYQEFLLQLQKQIPASAAGLYMDAGGTFHSWVEDGQDQEDKTALNDYHILAYNHLIDASNRIEEIFASPAGADAELKETE